MVKDLGCLPGLNDSSGRMISCGAYLDNSHVVWEVFENKGCSKLMVKTNGYSGVLSKDIAATLAPLKVCRDSCESYVKIPHMVGTCGFFGDKRKAPYDKPCLKNVKDLREECFV